MSNNYTTGEIYTQPTDDVELIQQAICELTSRNILPKKLLTVAGHGWAAELSYFFYEAVRTIPEIIMFDINPDQITYLKKTASDHDEPELEILKLDITKNTRQILDSTEADTLFLSNIPETVDHTELWQEITKSDHPKILIFTYLGSEQLEGKNVEASLKNTLTNLGWHELVALEAQPTDFPSNKIFIFSRN
jgi:hypothetical protein